MEICRKDNLYTKVPLRFRPDGKLRVLVMSDFQETLETYERTLHDMDALVQKEQPDVVVLGGDNCDASLVTEESLKQYLDLFSEPMEKRGIPWAHVFGNHDHDLPFDEAKKQALYESYPHCVSKHVDGIFGTTNFVLPVRASKGEDVVFAIWGLDTNRVYPFPEGEDPGHLQGFPNASCWDFPRFDQLEWYWHSSVDLENYAGHRVPGILFTHVAPWEAQVCVANPERCGTEGSTVEKMTLAPVNSGLFATVLQRGDIKCISSAHSHKDTFSGVYAGITLCLDGSAGYHPYGIEELRGGRVFDIDEREPGTISTRMSFYKDL